MRKIFLVAVVSFFLWGVLWAQSEPKPVPVPIYLEQIQPQTMPKELKEEKETIEIEFKEARKIPILTETCKNLCGDGICQEIVCLATGCPCPETPHNCPQDCKEEVSEVSLPLIQLPAVKKIEIDPLAEKPILADERFLEIKKFGEKAVPKISVSVQLPNKTETSVYLEIDKERKAIFLEHEGIFAQAQLPIKIEQKTIKTKTPKGEVSLLVLPSSVSQIVLQKEPQKIENLSLEIVDEKLVYKVKGTKEKKLLNIIPVKVPVVTLLSAENGEILKTQKFWLAGVFGKFPLFQPFFGKFSF